MRRKVLVLLIALSLVIGILPVTKAYADSPRCPEVTGNNTEYQNYSRWTKPITSYLEYCSDGKLMRVQSVSGVDGVLVEYFDTSYNLVSFKTIPVELPVFGAFYATDTNYFLLTGQNNPDESNSVEVYRITKYDKSWNRIASCGLYGVNTVAPFDAGSARMDVSGKYLLIRTCHKMYKSANDGLNHQANVTIQVDMDAMAITDSYTITMNSGYGYVSHSFNQFIKVENNKIVAVDHGDAYPRALALLKYKTDVSTGGFVPGYNNQCDVVQVIHFPGATGQNTTGASVGGFEISPSKYLVAGNTVVQDSDNLTRSTRNVFVAAVDKSTSAVTMNQITNYAEGDGTTSTPQFVKINDSRYILLWSRDGQVYYTQIDGSGNKTGSIYSMTGNLSDCVPTVVGSKLVWYVNVGSNIKFYEINLNILSQTSVTEVNDGHDFVGTQTGDGQISLVCSKCGLSKQELPMTSFNVMWESSGEGGWTWYSSTPPSVEQKIGNICKYHISSISPSDANSEMVVEVSDPNVVRYTPSAGNNTEGSFKMLANGRAVVRIYPKYNPDVVKTFTFEPSDHEHNYVWQGTQDAIATFRCTVCGLEKEVQTPTSMYVYWKLNPDGASTTSPASEQKTGNTYTVYISSVSPYGANKEMDITVSDPSVVLVEDAGNNQATVSMIGTGTATVTVASKYNPEVYKTYTFIVSDHDHDFEWVGTENGTATFRCSICGEEKQEAVPTSMTVYWNTNGGSGSYTTAFSGKKDIGDETYFWAIPSPGGGNNTLEIITSDSEIVSVPDNGSTSGKITALKTGEAKVTIRLKYNPSVSRTYTFKVNGDPYVSTFTADKQSPQVAGSSISLEANAVGGSWSFNYKFYVVDENNNTTIIRDFASYQCIWTPDKPGRYTLYVDAKDTTNGTIVTKSMEYEIAPFKLTRATLMLENDITVIFKAPAEYGDAYHDLYVDVVQDKENGEIKTQRIDGVLSADGQFYEFAYTGVNAKEVGDSLDATIYGYDSGNNLVQGETKEDYSVKHYCMSQLSKTDTELSELGLSAAKISALRTLMVDLLNYAAEAQNYFGYKTDSPANADLTNAQKDFASDDSLLDDMVNVTNTKYEVIASPQATWKAAGLNLLSKTTLRVKFAYTGNTEDIAVVAKINDVETYITEFDEAGANTYYAYFDGIKASQFDSPVDFVIMSGDTKISNTLRYSVESYASKNKDNVSVGDIVCAMMKYGKSAKKYAG